jgi:hypothetical protein
VQYLADLSCPRAEAKQAMSNAAPAVAHNRAVVLDWLLSQAVFAEYKDEGGSLTFCVLHLHLF